MSEDNVKQTAGWQRFVVISDLPEWTVWDKERQCDLFPTKSGNRDYACRRCEEDTAHLIADALNTEVINSRPRVVHCRKEHYDVYIGRGSKWGNPFRIGEDGTRAQVIAKYREYLMASPELLAAIPELAGKILGCWCAPKPCHGDVLLELANDFPEIKMRI